MSIFPREGLLAKQIAAVLLLSSSAAMAATTWTVNSCDETSFGNPGAHTGTLRFVAGLAGDGDTIDLSQLACSTISLQSGAIILAQDNVTLLGRGRDEFMITGKYGIAAEHDRVIHHTGAGWLRIQDLTIGDGYLDANAYDNRGGCIRSQGSVSLSHAAVTNCRTYATYSDAGGMYVKGELWLLNSVLSFNVSGSSASSNAVTKGGGAWVAGDFLAMNSSILYNRVLGAGEGGGIYVDGNASIYYSTIAGNHANNAAGGLSVRGNLILGNSTISGNSAHRSGAIEIRSAQTSIESSTIVWNQAEAEPGISFRPYQPLTVALENSLISGNTVMGTDTEDDIDRCCGAALETISLSGSHNIIRFPAIPLPAGMATTSVCPLLGQLRNNGGPTMTHALLSTSPGIDQGDATGVYDQRGLPRIWGPADIGAYEVDQDDLVFNNAFDSCP